MKPLFNDLANYLIDVKIHDEKYLPRYVDFDDQKKMTNEFYQRFFDNKRNTQINVLDQKNLYRKNKNLKDFNGRVYYGTEGNIIELPLSNTIKTACAIMHEKAHTYQAFEEKNELIPSFFELLFSFYNDKENRGLFKNNVNYKIKEAKKAALSYVYYSNKKKKYDLSYQESYLSDFYLAFCLLDLYLNGDKKTITNTLDDILFKDEKLDTLKTLVYKTNKFKNVLPKTLT